MRMIDYPVGLPFTGLTPAGGRISFQDSLVCGDP